ncbi:MAG TPA: NlpC/P60 family protein [Actinomycetota bacterium]|jgi:cell wall-associated NlpC family hydrolase|nr:NlpC/P60 family protein [Actinomycetota bacterium]
MPPSTPFPPATPRRPSRRSLGALILVAVLLVATALASAPAALAHPLDPGRPVPIPRPAVRPAVRPADPGPIRPGGGGATRRPLPRDLASLRTEATGLRAKLDDQNRRLEVLAEDLEDAYARGVDLLADAAKLDRRRRAAEQELATVQAQLDERARSTYMAGPGWFVAGLVGADDPADALERLPLQKAVLDADLSLVDQVARAKAKLDDARSRLSARLVAQAEGAAQLDAKRTQAERLAAEIGHELRTMDRRVAILIDRERRREEADQRAAFADYLAAARAAGTAPVRDGRASAAARKAVAVALAQLGSPYVWGAEGPSTFDCSGLTSFAYAAAGITIPRVSRAQFAAYGMRPVDPLHLVAGDLVFFADTPGNPGTIHHVGMYIGKGLMVEAPHTGAVVRTSSIWRPSYAGAVRPAP